MTCPRTATARTPNPATTGTRWGLAPLVRALILGAAAWSAGALPASAQTSPPPPTPSAPLQLKIVGGLGGVKQYKGFEEPFWREQLPALMQGEVQTTIVPFDKAGIRSHEMMRLMQLGVVPFGTALLSNIVNMDPELAAMDLAGLNPDMGALRRSVAAFRPHFEQTMRERHRIQVLAIYVYPAQVLFCTRPFKGLSDLSGRRVRISNPSQGDLIRPFGAQPVTLEFAEVVGQIRSGNVDCAITGSMSGNAIGLHEVTSHTSPYAVNWGISMFGANLGAWQALPAGLRSTLQSELPKLEAAIWADAEGQNRQGMACNTGHGSCTQGKPGAMKAVALDPEDLGRVQDAIRTSVLPAWLQRCGPGCASVWNRLLAPVTGVQATDVQGGLSR